MITILNLIVIDNIICKCNSECHVTCHNYCPPNRHVTSYTVLRNITIHSNHPCMFVLPDVVNCEGNLMIIYNAYIWYGIIVCNVIFNVVLYL